MVSIERKAGRTLRAVALLSAAVLGQGCASRWTPPAAWSERPEPAPFTVVSLDPRRGEMTAQLAAAAQVAGELHQRPYVELTSRVCAACHWLDHGLGDPDVKQAFGGTYVIRIDVDRWQGRMDGSGLDTHAGPLPAFVSLGDEGRPFGEWADPTVWRTDVPQTAAVALAAFFHTEPLLVLRRGEVTARR